MDQSDYVPRPHDRDDGPGPHWPLRVLSLDGGGVRGVITVTMLKAIEAAIAKIEGKQVKIREYFDVIGGTSTGGIITLGLAMDKDLDELCRLYKKLPREVLVGDTVPYDEGPLEENLKHVLGEDSKMTSIPEGLHVVITTVREDRAQPQLVLINNYADNQGEFKDWPLWKIARSTSAVPMKLKRVEERFVDGGVMSNCPAMDILTKIYNHERNPIQRTNGGIMLSLGTGIEPETPNHEEGWMTWMRRVAHVFVGGDIAETPRLLNSGFSSGPHMVARTNAWCDMIGMDYYHMDPTLKLEISWDCNDPDIIKGMIVSTNEYLLNEFGSEKIKAIALRLVEINNQRLEELGQGKTA